MIGRGLEPRRHGRLDAADIPAIGDADDPATAFLAKPFMAADLAAAVTALLEGQQPGPSETAAA